MNKADVRVARLGRVLERTTTQLALERPVAPDSAQQKYPCLLGRPRDVELEYVSHAGLQSELARSRAAALPQNTRLQCLNLLGNEGRDFAIASMVLVRPTPS